MDPRPRRRLSASCRRGGPDPGPDVGVTVLALSAGGALPAGQTLHLTLEAGGGRRFGRAAAVAWRAPGAGGHRAGVHFLTPLRQDELRHLTRP